MIATSSAAVSTGVNEPRVDRSSSARTRSGGVARRVVPAGASRQLPARATSPASSRGASATVGRAFATTFAISPARSSGIVATTIPPASRIPSHAAIASAVLGECSSTRSPGSTRNAAATAAARSPSSS